MVRAKEVPELDPAVLDALIGDAKTAEDIVGLARAIQNRLAERYTALLNIAVKRRRESCARKASMP